MPIYEVTDSQGRTVELEGDKPPDELTLDMVFHRAFAPSHGAAATPSATKPGEKGSQLSDPQPSSSLPPDPRVEAAANLPDVNPEEVATTPFVSIPRVGEPGTATRAVSEVGSGLVEQALLTPASGALGVSTLVPGLRTVAGALFTAAATKQAALKAGEASVTGSRQTTAEALMTGALAGLGATALTHPGMVPKSSEALKAAEDTLRGEAVTQPTGSGQVRMAPSGDASLGITPPSIPFYDALRDLFTGKTENAKAFLRGVAGESLPRMSLAQPEAAEAGVSYGSARLAAPLKADLFIDEALAGTDVDPVKFGAALTEDNLRSVEQERIASGEAPADVQVKTIIGIRGSPFPDEASYQAFLSEPSTLRAIDQHKAMWESVRDPLYREAASLDPAAALPSRGLQTGARINLFPVREGEPVPTGSRIAGGGGGGNLLATIKRVSRFARKATGEGESYVIDYRNIIARGFEGDFAIAMKNKMDRLLVESGDAAITKTSEPAPTLKGEPSVSFPYRNLALVEDGKMIPISRSLWIRKSLSGEYRRLAGTDAPLEIPIFTKHVGERLTHMAIAGLSEGTVHVSNLLAGILTRPGPTASPLFNSLLKVTGRADVPITIAQLVRKSFANNKAQLAELAEIGALKEGYHGKLMGAFLGKVDRAVRLTLDDIYQGMAAKGIVEYTPRARREFINQVGQYNKRLQGPLIKALRETHVGPFATAGRAFNVLGLKTIALSPGVKATSLAHAAALRADALAGWVGAFTIAATINYLTSGQVTGSPGTPLGDLDMGIDAEGKHHVFPLSAVFGYDRALRITGLRGFIESQRIGLKRAASFQRGLENVVTAAVNPAMGPTIHAGIMAATGHRAALPAVREAPVVEPGSAMPQMVADTEHALLEANPIIASAYEASQGKPFADILQRQLTRFAPRSAPTADLIEALPKIVEKRQMEDYINDISRRAKKLTPEASDKLYDQARDAIDNIEDPKTRREARKMLRGKQRFAK